MRWAALSCAFLLLVLSDFIAASKDCECDHSDRYMKRIQECRKKFHKPTKAQAIQVRKAQKFAFINCTEQYVPDTPVPQFIARLYDDKEMVKNMSKCVRETETAAMKDYGLAPELSNLGYKKCMKDAVKDHKKKAVHA